MPRPGAILAIMEGAETLTVILADELAILSANVSERVAAALPVGRGEVEQRRDVVRLEPVVLIQVADVLGMRRNGTAA
jgi:hypothetical protein